MKAANPSRVEEIEAGGKGTGDGLLFSAYCDAADALMTTMGSGMAGFSAYWLVHARNDLCKRNDSK
jgi:hypothetical protein